MMFGRMSECGHGFGGSVVLGAVVLAAGGAFAATERVIEVSPDGRTVVERRASELDAAAFGVNTAPANAGGRSADTVPFGTSADQEITLRRQIGGLVVEDMDRDGNNDVVAVIYTSASQPPYTEFQDQVFYGSGSGIDLTPGWLSVQATHTGDVQVGDVDGDTFPDIVTVHGGGVRADNVRIYFGAVGGPNTSPGYTSSTTPRVWGTEGVLVDADNDGDLDLFTSNQGISPQPVRPNFGFVNANGTLAPQPTWISADEAVQNGVDAADVNDDGWVDVAVSKGSGFLTGVYLSNPGSLPDTTPSITVDPGESAADRTARFGDVDGDGSLELFVNGNPGVLYDVTSPTLTPVYQTDPPFSGPQDTRLFDVDGDGDLDLAEAHFSDGRAHIYLNRNGVLDTAPSWTFDAPELATAIAFGDVNGDAAADLIIGYSGNVSLRVFFATGVVCPGDTDGDAAVTIGDLLTVIGALGTTTNAGPAGGDVDNSGDVSVSDLLDVVSALGTTCP